MSAEQAIDPRKRAMFTTLSVAAVAASVVAAGVTMLMQAGPAAAATAAVVCVLTSFAAFIPATLPNPTVPSKFGNAVLGATMLHTGSVLGLGFAVTLLTDFDRRGFLLGLIVGAAVLLVAQVWFGISVLKRALPTPGKES